MGHEGIAAAAYWDMIVRLLNNYTIFTGRERQGAQDLVNSLLNYGYGILYSRIWQAVIAERLNPHISYLHVMVAGKPTLAFDLIEEFRQQVVDKVVFSLITKGEEMAIEKGQLTHETKKRLIEKILERLNNKEKFRGRQMRMGEIIRFQAHAFVQHLQGIKTYKPYIGKW
jgi:CRISPR-associated protein Cas1